MNRRGKRDQQPAVPRVSPSKQGRSSPVHERGGSSSGNISGFQDASADHHYQEPEPDVEDNDGRNNGEGQVVLPPNHNPTTDNETGGGGVVHVPMQPFDTINNVKYVFQSCTEISLTKLEHENANKEKLNYRYIDVILLRIINPTGSNVGNLSIYKKQKIGEASTIQYTRLYLLKLHSANYVKENNRVVYMFITKNSNNCMWKLNTSNRDNGNLAVGSFLRVVGPSPIEKYMSGDIPVVVTRNPVLILKSPPVMICTQVNERVDANVSHGFVFVGCQVESMQQDVVSTSCSGRMCDRQKVNDWNGIKGCGCYGMSGNATCLVVQHLIVMQNGSREIKMKDFSSIKFNSLFMDGDFPFKCKEHMFQMTTAYVELTECIEKCIEYINTNGGFTVIGWYRRGEINDQTMVEVSTLNDTGKPYEKAKIGKTGASDITYHIVSIKPTNHEFMDDSKNLCRGLEDMKYKVANFQEDD